MRLHQLYDAGVNAMVRLWELSGDQGNEWKQVQVTLPLVASGQYYILLFEGVIGGTLSDMAIDDVEVKSGECVKGIQKANSEMLEIDSEMLEIEVLT